MATEPHRRTSPWWAASFRVAGLFAAVVIAITAGFSPVAEAVTAGDRAVAAVLSDTDRKDLDRIESYLNGIGTLQARFLQVSSTGEYAEGDVYLDRPGRMRIEYDPPVPVLIVAMGRSLVYYDKELEQVSWVRTNSTPAGFLLRESISLKGQEEVTVTGFERDAGALRVTLVRTEDPFEGQLTLVFADKPLVLKKWIVTDAQGVATSVSLQGTKFGLELDKKLFEFRDPSIFGPDER